MKTTIDLPDDLYALVKARAALEGRTLRSVMEELLKGWVVGEERGAGSEERGTTAQGHSGTDEERGRSEGGNEEGRTKNERGADGGRSEERGAGSGGEEERKTKREKRRGGDGQRGLVAEGAGESYGGTREGKRGARAKGSGSKTAKKVYPWDVLRMKWEREHNPHAPIEEIAGTLKGAGPDLDMAQAREAYMRDIADEWRRREAKGSRSQGDVGGGENEGGNGSRET